MKAHCTLQKTAGGTWQIQHSSDALGTVEITSSSRDEALENMKKELQYRLELCPCSGEVLGTVELEVSETFSRN